MCGRLRFKLACDKLRLMRVTDRDSYLHVLVETHVWQVDMLVQMKELRKVINPEHDGQNLSVISSVCIVHINS